MEVAIMAQKQKRDLVAFGRETMEQSLIATDDWELIKDAISLG